MLCRSVRERADDRASGCRLPSPRHLAVRRLVRCAAGLLGREAHLSPSVGRVLRAPADASWRKLKDQTRPEPRLRFWRGGRVRYALLFRRPSCHPGATARDTPSRLGSAVLRFHLATNRSGQFEKKDVGGLHDAPVVPVTVS